MDEFGDLDYVRDVVRAHRFTQRKSEEEWELLWNGFTDTQRQILNNEFPNSRHHQFTHRLDKFTHDNAFRNWVSDLLVIQVELKPAGRAVLRDPEYPYRVELFWSFERKSKNLRAKSANIVADDFLSLNHSPELHRYLVAFLFQAQKGVTRSFAKAPQRRPVPGQAIDLGFYTKLLEAYDQLVIEGRPDPAAELARRYDENRSTVKSWLRRARQYTQRQEGDKQ